MPISPIKLQRRMAELGRIRLGHKTGTGKGRPAKLAAFRFTSPNERYIQDLATLYGGTPQPWDNNGKPEFEVFTEAKSIPVIAVKGGLSQWMETWSGGGCVHRCDGERDVEGNLCDPDDPKHRDAKPTTRLSVMLPELEAIGVFRLESHGWNAAAEIPAVAELAQFVGELVPANLNLVERRSVKDGQTSRFVVPVLDLQIGTARLRELVNEKSGLELAAPASAAAAIEAPAQPAEQPAPQQGVKVPTPEQVAAMDADTARKALAYLDAHNAGDHPATQAVRARLASLTTPDEDGAVEAEIVEDSPSTADGVTEPNPDAVWQQVLSHAGGLGWTLDQTRADFTESMGMDPGEASGFELAAYLQQMTTGEAAVAS
jgi:hypothetical protein